MESAWELAVVIAACGAAFILYIVWRERRAAERPLTEAEAHERRLHDYYKNE